MAAAKPKLDWAIVRLGNDLNWWVQEISDTINWDTEGLGILDPRQMGHVMEQCEALIEYGFDPSSLDNIFYRFRIVKEVKEGQIRLARTSISLLDPEEPLFALPDVLDEEKGPYADFISRITRLRVKLLNEMIDFKQNLTVDEVEEDIRERQNGDFLEGRSTHFFTEVASILEYVPEGYELEGDTDDVVDDDADAEALTVSTIPDLDEEDEKIEEDDTMRWDEDDSDSDEGEESAGPPEREKS
jgi:hypothetical protein